MNQKIKDFPIGVFPQKVQIILNEKLNCNFPVVFLATTLLFVFSVLIGAGRKLCTNLGMIAANIYVALIGPSGANKTTPLNWALKPLLLIDQENIRKYQKAMKEWKDQMDDKELRKDAGPMPVCPRLLVSDITDEKLRKMLATNPLGLGQYYDELKNLFSNAKRYKKSGNDEMLLSLFSGQPFIVDRVIDDEIICPNPYFSLIGSIQPELFKKLMISDDRVSSGLFYRFLEARMFDNPPIPWHLTDDLPQAGEDYYEEIVKKMLDIRDIGTSEKPIVYQFSAAAMKFVESWQNDKETEIDEKGTENEKAVFRKLQLYVLKFSLILQVVWDVCEGKFENTVVNEKTANFAILLADYFFENARDFSGTLPTAGLSRREKDLLDSLEDVFETAEARTVAQQHGFGKTAFFEFLGKAKGLYIEQTRRGVYRKLVPSATCDSSELMARLSAKEKTSSHSNAIS